METEKDFKLIGLDSTVSVLLTDKGYEKVRSFYLDTYKDFGHEMLRHFEQTSMFGKVITTSLRNMMMIFGTEMLGPRMFESNSFVIHESSIKELETPKHSSPYEAAKLAQ
ncbi:MAG: hypothetical protein IKD36_01910 [Clostridia bacterium]|nr:hypothetical protein [Clostridia bacterium]